MLIGDIVDVFRKGRSVANPELWKNMGACSAALAGLGSSALAIAAVFGYRVDLDRDALEAIAGGIAGVLFLFNGGVHLATSDKVGLPAKPKPDDGRGQPSTDQLEQPDYRG